MKVFMLDNVDSFTYNLVDEFHVLGLSPVIYRNTLPADFILAQMEACSDQVLLVLSPGPGSPENAGCLMELIAKTAGKYPILGICLGHQALIEHYGGKVGRAPEIVHGKSANVKHSATGAFKDIEQPLPVARYHSLVGLNIPSTLTVTAAVEAASGEQLPMAITHQTDRVMGFQFHPESILTTYGSTLLEQSIRCLTEQTLKE
ncbi:aminodeoxychorismate/anthranilate synthase component II [Thalassotalea sp. 1_MG-2023]|uniref:aminodeoxychorismate/anthranilate synthase component II n=1 Tax=Thalassotalea sp. 1_MG-2023 TaxID=3062680 RepID=UPI0026E42B83|nr:aminodeoxychorismate/anthranilate synthase component II [Thalassotalea sp. 1_MG-2023]MDO6427303.1 aminodeoxychorismate/anthranilate synthase component II [Thalassotalea sp. 1_MG-2023]